MTHLCVSLVLHGQSPHALKVLEVLQKQELDEGTNISLVIVDNGVPETLRAELLERFGGSILLLKNRENLGFSAGVNQCLAEAQRFEADFLLLLNPDLRLDPNAVREMLLCASRHPDAAMFTPKLLRADANLEAIEPAVIDACGMQMLRALRHVDRGAGEIDSGQFGTEEEVFGGTGACLLLRVDVAKSLCLERSGLEKSVWKIYPQLEIGAAERPQLLDEAFFAYREDADLAWRAQILGKKTIFCPSALGFHVRKVTPEGRATLPPEVNLWSVRNRFLLQFNNLRAWLLPEVVLPGLIFRNLIVISATLLRERTSIAGLVQAVALMPRALRQRRSILQAGSIATYRQLSRWFV